ncbi:MAG: dihydropteroate synthase, partial [Planctomycetes bacterium]|nr:dihydropteroate synthase [Planctomycetota bacterium]
MSKEFISIAESVHASIPTHAKAMKALADKGIEAYSASSEDLDHVIDLIETQVQDGATYIAVNLDALGEDDPQIAVDHMIEYVKLVRKHGNGVPVCIDSSDDNVLIAGLKQWYNTDQTVKKPLINSVKVYSMNNLFPLKKDYDYAFVGLLMSEQGGQHSIDELYSLAKEIFDEAVNKYGFDPDDIIYDSTVFPLAIDLPMTPGEPSYTHKTFQTMKKIKDDPKMQGVHFSGGITNCARDLPARKIGVMRAYVHKAMEYGLDAGI